MKIILISAMSLFLTLSANLLACQDCMFQLMERLICVREVQQNLPEDSDIAKHFKGYEIGLETAVLLVQFNHVDPGLLEDCPNFQQAYSMDHFEHYKNLMLQSQVYEIKNTIIESQNFLPQESYEKLLFHIKISEDQLN